MVINLKDIVAKLPVVRHVGNINRNVSSVVSLKDGPFTAESILWISDKNLQAVKQINAGIIICSTALSTSDLNDHCTYLIVQKPRQYFLNLVREFFFEKEPSFISERSVIHPSVKIGANVTIHPGVVIEKDCRIGDGTSINCNTVLKKGTIVGNRVTIGCNNTIGGLGFGYEKNDEGRYEFIPHIGNVVIEDDVEIGNNTTIDRAVLGSTLISRNAKIDNLVHIAHGVTIGENSLIIANAMIAGSTVIERNVWVAPSASVLNQVVVGENATIGMGAVVLKNVQPGQTIVGNPGKDLASIKKST